MMMLLSSSSVVALLVGLSTTVQAYKDDSYYMANTGNPNVDLTMYWKDATNIFQDLSKFSALYVSFHSCVWSPLSYAETSDDIDETDYWYLGSVPAQGANAAFSLYGHLSGGKFKGCNGDSFINSFHTTTGFDRFVTAMGYAGQNGFSSYSGMSAECQGGSGVGCDANYGFAIHQYSTNRCDPQYAKKVSDGLSNFNKAMSKAQCVKIYDSSSSYSSGGMMLLQNSTACDFMNVYSPYGSCPDPYGVIADYVSTYSAGIQQKEREDPFLAYNQDKANSIKKIHTGLWLIVGAMVVIFVHHLDSMRQRRRGGRKGARYRQHRKKSKSPRKQRQQDYNDMECVGMTHEEQQESIEKVKTMTTDLMTKVQEYQQQVMTKTPEFQLPAFMMATPQGKKTKKKKKGKKSKKSKGNQSPSASDTENEMVRDNDENVELTSLDGGRVKVSGEGGGTTPKAGVTLEDAKDNDDIEQQQEEQEEQGDSNNKKSKKKSKNIKCDETAGTGEVSKDSFVVKTKKWLKAIKYGVKRKGGKSKSPVPTDEGNAAKDDKSKGSKPTEVLATPSNLEDGQEQQQHQSDNDSATISELSQNDDYVLMNDDDNNINTATLSDNVEIDDAAPEQTPLEATTDNASKEESKNHQAVADESAASSPPHKEEEEDPTMELNDSVEMTHESSLEKLLSFTAAVAATCPRDEENIVEEKEKPTTITEEEQEQEEQVANNNNNEEEEKPDDDSDVVNVVVYQDSGDTTTILVHHDSNENVASGDQEEDNNNNGQV